MLLFDEARAVLMCSAAAHALFLLNWTTRSLCRRLICGGVIVSTISLGYFASASDGEGERSPDSSGEWTVPRREARRKNPFPPDERSLKIGKKIYVAECLDCHGEEGRGDGPGGRDLEPVPTDLTDPELWKQTDGALNWKIKVGREPMPAYEELIDEDQLWHIVNYVRSLAPPENEAGNEESSNSASASTQPTNEE